MGNKTNQNLMAAFAGESQANRKYLAFSKKAEKEGFTQVAKLFRAAAEAETIHAHTEFRLAGNDASTLDNLKAAIEGETYELTTMYPEMIKDAEAEGETAIAKYLGYVGKVEGVHADLYKKALAAEGKIENVDYYVCGICGYTHEGPHSDDCPVCGAASKAFYKVA